MIVAGFLGPEEAARRGAPRRLPRRVVLAAALAAGLAAAAMLGGRGVMVPKPGPRRYPARDGLINP